MPRQASVGAGLWFGVLGGIVAWVLHLGVSYASLPWICAAGSTWVLHVVTGATAATALAATLVSLGRLRAAGREPGGPPTWLRFLALAGVGLSAFFLLVIVAEGLPALLQANVCEAVPVREQPIVWSPHGVPTAATFAALVYLRGTGRLWAHAGRGRGIRRGQALAYLGGLAAMVVALTPLLDTAAHTRLSAHMVQHLLLMVVAAPLLVTGRPFVAFAWTRPGRGLVRTGRRLRRRSALRAATRLLLHPATILAAHVAALWLWHHPSLYEAALRSTSIHRLEHAAFLGTAVLFWWSVWRTPLLGRRAARGAAVLYVLATALQGGALGALMIFAPTAWYPSHAGSTAAAGLDALADQQVAGALMWVPAGLVYAAAALFLLRSWLRAAAERVGERERAGWSRIHRSGRVLPLLLVAFLGVSGCGADRASETPPRQVAGGDPEVGREEAARHGCGACHTIPGVRGASGRVAAPLTAFAERSFVAGVLPNNAEELVRWIVDPPSIDANTAMPNLGVTEREARHIAAYLYTLR